MNGISQDARRIAYAERFGLSPKRGRLAKCFMDQLDKCKDDESRRILLGVSIQGEESLAPITSVYRRSS